MFSLVGIGTLLAVTSCVVGAQVPFIQNPRNGHALERGSTAAAYILTPEFNKFIEEVLANGTVPGMSLGIIHPNGEVEFGAFGRKTEDGDKMTVDTLFSIGSCSKAFLASSLGMLMDDFAHGRNNTPLPAGVAHFDWYTKVADILPDEWKLLDDWASAGATFRDILSHQTGLPRHDLSYTSTDKPVDVLRNMRYLRPAFELRQRWHYNNQMYILGAYVVSKFAGKTFEEFVQERIFGPLNMTSSTYLESEASIDGRLTQSWTIGDRRIPYWFPDEEAELLAGAGGVISNVIDMAKWVKTWLHNGVDPTTNATVIPKLTYETATTSHAIMLGRAAYPEMSAIGYGMAWMSLSYQGHEIITHSGGLPGFSAEVFFLPWDSLGIVTLANADVKHLYETVVIYRIIEDYFSLNRSHSSRLLSEATKKDATSLSESRNQDDVPRSAPPLPLEAYAGYYLDRGYPNITLCAPTSDSPDCQVTLRKFAHFENVTAFQGLYAILPSIWVSHARIRHKEGNLFTIAGTYLFPQGYGKDTSPFETWEEGQSEGTVEFVVDETADGETKVMGMGLRGLVGETTNNERQGGTIEEIAEVYWVKEN